jgi:hypothetical protein
MTALAHSCRHAVILTGRHKGQNRLIEAGQTVIEIEGETLSSVDQSDEQFMEVFRYAFDAVSGNDPTTAGFTAAPEQPSMVRVR